MFKDDKYDSMDDISKLLEPYECLFNKCLSYLPKEIDISTKDILGSIPNIDRISSTTACKRDIIERKMSSFNLPDDIYNSIKSNISAYADYYEFHKDDIFSFNVSVNDIDSNDTLFKLIKTVASLSDDTIKKHIRQILVDCVNRAMSTSKSFINSNAKELMQLLDIDMSSVDMRSYRSKRRAIIDAITVMINSNKLNIRDTEFAKKVGKWMEVFLTSGSLAAIKNLCKLKVLTYNNVAIYSISGEEEV